MVGVAGDPADRKVIPVPKSNWPGFLKKIILFIMSFSHPVRGEVHSPVARNFQLLDNHAFEFQKFVIVCGVERFAARRTDQAHNSPPDVPGCRVIGSALHRPEETFINWMMGKHP